LAESEKTPVALLTGFLGSGKTTLLSRLLAHPAMGETAVIVNELGEVAIDHHLLRRVDERTVLLKSGCVCCSLRGDLADELRDLLGRRDRGEVPPFRRVVVETTGLADPAPILYTLLSEPVVKHHFRLERVIATVDAVNGLLEPESVRQVAAADTVVVTKTDLHGAGDVRPTLERLNPTASVFEVSFGDVEPATLFATPGTDLRSVPGSSAPDHSDVQACVLFLDEELDWGAFGIWLTMLLQSHGQDVLRVKGLLNVGGPGPLLLNGVQHVVHPPMHLDEWPDDDHRSRIVFIGRGIDAAALVQSLVAFNALAKK
jgi:G3E family GTPase